MHHAFSLIFHIQHFLGVYFFPGSNFATFEEVKVPSFQQCWFFFQKSGPWRILEDLGVVNLIQKKKWKAYDYRWWCYL